MVVTCCRHLLLRCRHHLGLCAGLAVLHQHQQERQRRLGIWDLQSWELRQEEGVLRWKRQLLFQIPQLLQAALQAQASC